jgi:acyl-coenzyme A thioesterase PaaI-like protein
MSTALSSPGTRLRAAWRRLSPLPGGRWLFSRLLRLFNPYSGAVGATVMTLEPGHAVVVLKERRAVRNHLDSVHAIALANIAEMASGLAMLCALPDSARGIPVALSIDYLKKARGVLTAEARVALPDVTVDGTHPFSSSISDEAGDVVARATVTWKLGPVEAQGGRQG